MKAPVDKRRSVFTLVRRAVSILLALLLLAALYRTIDYRRVAAILGQADPVWLITGLALLVPMVLLAGIRLRVLVPREAAISVGEAVRLNLAASVLNLVLPSKMGDLAKSWFFRQRGHLPGTLALALVVFERTCDMLSLLAWCSFGLLLLHRGHALRGPLAAAVIAGMLVGVGVLTFRRLATASFAVAARLAPSRFKPRISQLGESWDAMHTFFWARKGRLAWIAVLSLAIWFVNLIQVWFLIRALGERVPVIDSLGLTPLAILAGLLPVTFAGVGTRDIAVVFFYQEYLAPATGAALGLLLTFRYALLALGGLPFLGPLSKRRQTTEPDD
jgi:uncharacterized protein (TIRG00374 family)